ncbi:MAG: heme lyase CcmF/NrfE family subunit [Terriglobales bacterium]
MQLFGSFAILLALVLAGYGLVAGIVGLARGHKRLIASAQRASIAVFPVVTVAVFCLIGLILRNDFTVAYVAEHSNRALPFYYKIAVLWSGQEGSLLFWTWLLSGYAFIVLLGAGRKTRRAAPQLAAAGVAAAPPPGGGTAGLLAPARGEEDEEALSPRLAHRNLMPTAAVILAAIECFFLLLNNFAASAFASLPVATPVDGNGLNPLLQYPQMVMHPPMLYLGYVGFSVPFAFCLAALIKRYPGDRWIHVTRRWTMVAWLFLTIGIVLGGNWAYRVLGWGGYWAWDPVENASFLPWLTATAFLHSVMMQEKRGMLKIWNVWLVFATFLLAIFGDFLTRSGLVASVHAFAQSSIGGWFVVFLALTIIVCLWAFFRNRDYLRSDNILESTVSRESGFLFNNFILLVITFAVLWGTVFPVISEWVEGQKIDVGRVFFDRINVPLFLFLLFLTGVGPLLAWRKTSLNALKRNFTWPAAAGILVAIFCLAGGLRDPYPLVCFALAGFVLTTIAMEFGRGAAVLRRRGGVPLRGLLGGWPGAVGQLTMRNTRRYGGYIVHVGILLIAIGIAGSGLNLQTQGAMPYQARMHIGPYTLISEHYTQNDNANFSADSLAVAVERRGQYVTTMYPARRYYKASNQDQSMVAIRSTPLADLYLVYAGNDSTSNAPVLHAYWNPLIIWIWIGTIIVALGTILAMLPSRRPAVAAPAPAGRQAATEAPPPPVEVEA